MLGFLKRLKEKKEAKLRAKKEALKNQFISYINAYKDENSTMDAMYTLIHSLDFDMNSLVKKYDLVVDFDFLESEDFYEIEVYAAIEKPDNFYIAVGTQEGKNTILLNDDSELDADQFTTSEIITKIIEEIENYHQRSKDKR